MSSNVTVSKCLSKLENALSNHDLYQETHRDVMKLPIIIQKNDMIEKLQEELCTMTKLKKKVTSENTKNKTIIKQLISIINSNNISLEKKIYIKKEKTCENEKERKNIESFVDLSIETDIPCEIQKFKYIVIEQDYTEDEKSEESIQEEKEDLFEEKEILDYESNEEPNDEPDYESNEEPIKDNESNQDNVDEKKEEEEGGGEEEGGEEGESEEGEGGGEGGGEEEEEEGEEGESEEGEGGGEEEEGGGEKEEGEKGEEEGEERGEEEEEEEVVEVQIKGITYFASNEMNGDIYEKLPDEDVGDVVGKYENGIATIYKDCAGVEDDIEVEEVEINGVCYYTTNIMSGEIYEKMADESVGDSVIGNYKKGIAVFL